MLLKSVWILILFGRKYHQENAKNGIYERLDFIINPLKARVSGTSQLPRLSEKSGYGPARDYRKPYSH